MLKILIKTIKTVLLLSMILVMGCVHFKTRSTFHYISWHERQAKLQQNKRWVIQGSLSITCDKKRDIVRFTWEQNRDDYLLNILGPMNLSSAKIVGIANKVEFYQSSGKCARASSPEQLVFKQLGWRLPVSNIRYWILAFPAPTKATAHRFDQYGHLIAFEQNEWKISYSDFQVVKDGIDLPGTVELKNKNFLIKLKIESHSL